MSDQPFVLDTSALLACLFYEQGGDYVASLFANGTCLISTVNVAELVSKLVDVNHPHAGSVDRHLASLGIRVETFTVDQATQAGLLRSSTRAAGLSLGDRACLALAIDKQAVALTADQAWLGLGLPLDIINIRST